MVFVLLRKDVERRDASMTRREICNALRIPAIDDFGSRADILEAVICIAFGRVILTSSLLFHGIWRDEECEAGRATAK
jgi:hypothetical protein